MKKFIRLEGERVVLIHNMPFDSINGLHKTEEELLQEGILLDSIPEAEQIDGKIALPFYNAEKGFYYVYEDEPPHPATTADIQQVNAKLDYIGMMTEVL